MLQMLSKLLEACVDFLNLVFCGLRAGLKLLYVVRLKTRRLDIDIAVALLIIVQLNTTPVSHSNGRVFVISRPLFASKSILRHVSPLIEHRVPYEEMFIFTLCG